MQEFLDIARPWAITLGAMVIVSLIWLEAKQTVWVIRLTPLTARGEDAVLMRIVDELAKYGTVTMQSSARGGMGFIFVDLAQAQRVHQARIDVLHAAGLETTDMDISDIERSFYGACLHPGPYARTLDNQATCIQCGKITGSWPM